MNNVFEKLSVRSSDYVACINIEDDKILSSMQKSVKGMVCAGKISKTNFDGLKNIKIVKKTQSLDEGIFHKVLCIYNDELNLRTLVKISENFGLVLVCNTPRQKAGIFEDLLSSKAGVCDFWHFNSGKEGYVDFLFKVRKY